MQNRHLGLFFLRKFLPHLAGAVDRLTRAKIVQLEELAELNFAFLALAAQVGDALGPLDRLFPRLHLDDPVSGDEFLRFGKGAVDHRALASGKLDAGARGAGLEPGQVEQHAGLHQLLIVLTYGRKDLLARLFARFRVLAGLHDHHEPHEYHSLLFGLELIPEVSTLPNSAFTLASNEGHSNRHVSFAGGPIFLQQSVVPATSLSRFPRTALHKV